MSWYQRCRGLGGVAVFGVSTRCTRFTPLRLLVALPVLLDGPQGGRFTFKRYKSAKVVDPETGEWMHALITLEPLNPECSPIEIAANEEDEFRVMAEFVEVL